MSSVDDAFSAAMYRPDWVVVGSPTDWRDFRVCVLASTTLTEAQLTTERDTYDVYSLDSIFPIHTFMSAPQVTLEVKMRDYVIIYAQSYAEAFAKLAKQWDPDRPSPERTPIESNHQALEDTMSKGPPTT